VLRHLPADVQAHLDALLVPPPSDAPDAYGNGVPASPEIGASAVSRAFATAPSVSWYHLKADPGPVSLESLRFEITKLQRLRAVGFPQKLFAQTPPAVLRRYRLRAGAEKTAELKRHPRALRLTLIAVMVWQRQMEITDTIVDVLLGMLHRTEIRAEKRVKQELLGDIVRVDGKQALLVRIAEAALNDPNGQVAQVVFPAAGGKERLQQIVKEATSGAVFRQTVQIRVRRSYQAHLRQLLGPVLRTLTFRCNNDRYRPLLHAIQVLRDHLDYGGAWYPTDVVVPLEGIVPTTLRPVVVEEDEHGGIRINRINYELCVLQTLYAKLRCKEIWVEGADTYRNPEDDLPQDFVARRTAYYAALRQEIHEGLNVVEAWNRANTFIFYGKGNVFATNSPAQQETAMLCLHLLQACLVFINTHLIQEVLADPAWRDRMTDADWRGLTPLFFSTVTPYGDFVLDMTRRIPLKTPVEAVG
jgi:hypothetical protein